MRPLREAENRKFKKRNFCIGLIQTSCGMFATIRIAAMLFPASGISDATGSAANQYPLAGLWNAPLKMNWATRRSRGMIVAPPGADGIASIGS